MTDSGRTETPPEVRALEENLWSMWSVFGRGRDSRLVDTASCLAYETPMTRIPYNGVFRFRVGPDDADRRIDELVAPYRRRGVPFVWVVHPTSEPGDLRDRLRSRGLARAEVLCGMTRPLTDLPDLPPVAPGVEIFEGDPGAFVDWMRMVWWRYNLPPDTSEYLASVYRAEITEPAQTRRTRWWGARKEGAPISKAVLHLHGRSAGIYGVATHERGRGLHLATILTLTTLHAARERGAELAVLQATPVAVKLYERLGFVRVADFELWSEPGRLSLSVGQGTSEATR